jgi:hypothetical protein
MRHRFRVAAGALVLCALPGAAVAQLPSWINTVGTETQINSHSGVPVTSLTPALGADGGMVTAWVASAFEVWARAQDPAGHPLGLDYRLDHDVLGTFRADSTVTALAGGGYIAAWGYTKNGFTDPLNVWARRLGAGGTPAGGEMRLDTSGLVDQRTLHLAALRNGGFAAVWAESDGTGLRRLAGRRFDDSAQALEEPVTLAAAPLATCRLAVRGAGRLRDGGYGVVWSVVAQTGAAVAPCSGSFVRRVTASGQPDGPAVELGALDLAAMRADGSVVGLRSGDNGLAARLYDAAGRPLGAEFTVFSGPGDPVDASVAADDQGSFLILWIGGTLDHGATALDVYGRFYDSDGAGLGDAFRANGITRTDSFDQLGPRAATDGRGNWAASWADSLVFGVDNYYGGDGWTARFAACPAGELCVRGGRFRLDVTWRDPRTGKTGGGQAVPVAGDSGAFWFFGPENVELFAKVLDGRAVNSAYWVFYASLSDVEFDLTVTDAVNGAHKTYHNDPYTLASRADTAAFPSVSPTTAAVQAPAVVQAVKTAVDPQALSLQGDRFRVEVAWKDPRTGATGTGQAVSMSDDSGYFWFFGPNNIELVTKVLDGRAVNHHFWVFYASLTDVEYTITVTDGLSGAKKTYHNPPYTLASRADTAAF